MYNLLDISGLFISVSFILGGKLDVYKQPICKLQDIRDYLINYLVVANGQRVSTVGNLTLSHVYTAVKVTLQDGSIEYNIVTERHKTAR